MPADVYARCGSVKADGEILLKIAGSRLLRGDYAQESSYMNGATVRLRSVSCGPVMTDHHHSSEPNPRISAERGALLTTLVNLWPYIWPSDRREDRKSVV